MEGRQLNFSTPLLSVRRISTTPVSTNVDNGKVTPRLANGRHSLPLPKSDFLLEQVTKPVAVPFHWEDIPGRSKEFEKPKVQPREDSYVTRRLPLRKLAHAKSEPLRKEQADQKDIRPYLKSFSATYVQRSKEGADGEKGAKEYEDNTYSDAPETLSPPAESRSMNCSAAGTSHSHSANVRPSIDPQTQDSMMKRFLPAAKAMALETPHIAIKKQLHATPFEQPSQVSRIIRQDTNSLPNQQRSHKEVMELVQYSLYKEEEKSDEEEDAFVETDSIAPKGCRFFPWLGISNFLCPMKSRARALISCSSGVSTPGKISGKPTRVRSHSPQLKPVTKTTKNQSHSQPLKPVTNTTKNQSHSQPLNKFIKPTDIQSHSRPLNMVTKPAITHSNCQPLKGALPRLPKLERRFYSGELPRLTSQYTQSNLFRHSGEQPKGKSSPFRKSRSPTISPYRNERPKSPFTGGGFLGVPIEETVKGNSSKFDMNDKVGHKSQELLNHQRIKQGPYTVIPMIEKTLYVDSVNTTKRLSNVSSAYTKDRVDAAVEDLRILLKRNGMDEISKEESLFQDIKGLLLTNFESNGISEPAALESVKDDSSSFSDKGHIKDQVVAVQDSQLGYDTRSDDSMKDDPGNADSTITVQSPLRPPLPRSPSQSWLSSTLSSFPSRRSVSPSAKRLDSKTSSSGTKWETIVKTSNLHHDHVRYSEELITHVCQQSKC